MLLDRHKNKIRTAQQVRDLIGDHSRPNTVALCHGVFDVVHPGHMRHLAYARSHCDVLVVSVTSDRYVDKGPYRPHVPEELRVANVSMYDIVDYVVLNDAEKPLDLIRLLQPNFYAKGFEYSETARPGHTIEEAVVVAEYGGEVMFTPGDFVRSSSVLLEAHPPDIRYDRLKMVMDSAGVRFDHLYQVVQSFPTKHVHVVGDVIVDALVHVDVVGGPTKTPTISVRRGREECFVGGSGVVAMHLAAAGATVYLGTVVGADHDGEFVLDELESASVQVEAVVDNARPTTRKEAIVSEGYRLLKIDTVDNRSISDAQLDQLRASVSSFCFLRGSAVVYSDFRHGIFNQRTVPVLVDVLRGKKVLKVADSQVASRWGNIADFTGFDLITPNEREARFVLADQDSGVRPLASKMYDAANCGVLMMKMGERGVLTCTSGNHEDATSFFVLDSFADHVVDPVGAGDALLAYATLAATVDNRPAVASILGSMAAGCACELDGNLPITPEYVCGKIDKAREECGDR